LFGGKLNIDQVNRGLALGWACHHDQSYFEDIKVLPPAHNLIFKQGGLSIWQYWDLDPTKKSGLSFDDKKEHFASMFADSLHIHLRSDAVIGGCLSGGLDSSSIASLIARNYSDRDYKIFNIYYQNSDGLYYDERPFVNEVIKKYPNIQPHFFTPSDKEIEDAFDKSMYHYDVPVNGSSYVSQHFLMKMAHDNGVRVLIDGQGADEYLAGYMHTMYPMMAGYLKNFKWLNALQLFINHSTTQKLGAKEMSMLMAKTLMTLLKSDEYIYQFELAKVKPYLLPGHPFDGNLAFRDYSRNMADNFLYNLTLFTSLPTLLHYCDRNSMSFGVEGRVPFLDHRLVEFVFSLSEQDRISNRAETKYIMRQSLADVLPEAIAQRKDKKGFVTPGENLWLRGPLKYLLDIDYKQMDWLDKNKLSVMVEDYKKGSNANAKYVWRLAALNRWLAVGIR
jgi:asparagine synthase (glutamine-hydrolysing)